MKSDVAAGLINATWPVLVVNESGTIQNANPAAAQVFGSSLPGGSTALASIWLPENALSTPEFLSRWERAPAAMSRLMLMGIGGAHVSYQACICSLLDNGQKYFIFQLFPPPVAATAKTRPGPWMPGWRTSKSWIARCNWRARFRWISTTR